MPSEGDKITQGLQQYARALAERTARWEKARGKYPEIVAILEDAHSVLTGSKEKETKRVMQLIIIKGEQLISK